jgi:hypothetical protein
MAVHNRFKPRTAPMSVENQDVIQTSETPQENVGGESNQLDQSIRDQLNYAFSNEVELPAKEAEQVNPEVKPEEQNQEITPTVFNETEFLREFNVESKDAIKAALAELNELKAKASTPAEFQFASDEAKKLAAAINSLDLKAVKQYVDTQAMLADAETLSEAEQLKLYIKMKNPMFDQELVDDEFNELYTVKNEDDFDDPIALRKAKVKVQQRMMNDTAQAKEFFAQHKQSIKLPEIQSIQPTVDAEYEAYKASTAQSTETYQKVIVPTITALKESDLGLNVKISDPQNQLDFAVSVAPDKSDLEFAKSNALNFEGFLETFWKDGKLDGQRLARLILLDKKADSYFQSAARQGAMAERKRVIERETGVVTTQRDTNVSTGEKTELQKRMEYALSGF